MLKAALAGGGGRSGTQSGGCWSAAASALEIASTCAAGVGARLEQVRA